MSASYEVGDYKHFIIEVTYKLGVACATDLQARIRSLYKIGSSPETVVLNKWQISYVVGLLSDVYPELELFVNGYFGAGDEELVVTF